MKKQLLTLLYIPNLLFTFIPFFIYYMFVHIGIKEFITEMNIRKEDLINDIAYKYIEVFPTSLQLILSVLLWIYFILTFIF